MDKEQSSSKHSASGKVHPAGSLLKAVSSMYVEGHTSFTHDENKGRGNWTGKADFILACLGYAVGLGNVWRFPFVCYENGGAVFFIPYCIMLVFVGIPIFFLELSIGQFTSSSPLTCWQMAPFFKGIGVGMMLVSAMVGMYYVMIIGWAFWYLFASLINATDLPWQYCNEDAYYTTQYCSGRLAKNLTAEVCSDLGFTPNLTDGVCYNKTADSKSLAYIYGVFNRTSFDFFNATKKVILPSEDYFKRRMLGEQSDTKLSKIGAIQWEMVLSLLLTWIIVFLSLVKGIKSSGKVVYFTAIFPYVVLVILLCRGATLEGHLDGVKFYITEVDTTKLKEPEVWKTAATQIFFSLSASWGGLIALASYNRFHNDCLRDSLIVSLGNCLTSFFAGFVVFSFVGFQAHQLQLEVKDAIGSGSALAFIVYADAVTHMPVAALWSVLFFFMLITLGLDSEFTLVETILTSLMDRFPKLREKKAILVGVLCITLFLLGLPFTTRGGQQVLDFVDSHAANWNVMVIALCELICMSYIYTFFGGPMHGPGWTRWREDIRLMLGTKNMWNWDCSYIWWCCCWYIISPGLLLFVIGFSLENLNSDEEKKKEIEKAVWEKVVAWMMTIIVIVPVIGIGVFNVCVQWYKKEPIGDLFRPTREWGPALPQHRRLVLRYVPTDVWVIDPFNLDEAKVESKGSKAMSALPDSSPLEEEVEKRPDSKASKGPGNDPNEVTPVKPDDAKSASAAGAEATKTPEDEAGNDDKAGLTNRTSSR